MGSPSRANPLVIGGWSIMMSVKTDNRSTTDKNNLEIGGAVLRLPESLIGPGDVAAPNVLGRGAALAGCRVVRALRLRLV